VPQIERYRDTFNNKSKFINEIGAGSQASVDLHKLHSGLEVAVKNYGSIDGTIAADALKEVNALQHLVGCSNIIQLLDVTTEVLSDQIILRLMLKYMNYDLSYFIENVSLDNRLKHLDSIMEQLLNVLNNLYYRGIIHCDIKPENILVDVVDNVVNMYLADFGLSVQLPCELEYRHIYKNINGTPLFKAPELLLKNHYYTEKIDVWALGLTLLEYIIDTPITMPKIQKENQIIYAIMEQLTTPLLPTKQNMQLIKDGKVHDSIDVKKIVAKVTDNISTNTIDIITAMLQVNPVDRFNITGVKAKLCPIVVEGLEKGPLDNQNDLTEYYKLIYKINYISQQLSLTITTCYLALDLFSRYAAHFKILPITSAACLVLMIKLFDVVTPNYNTIAMYYNSFTTTELKYEELLVMKNLNYIFTFCDNDEMIDVFKKNTNITNERLHNTYKLMETEGLFPGEMFTFEIIDYLKNRYFEKK
jgi:serine/threonine protein kinase